MIATEIVLQQREVQRAGTVSIDLDLADAYVAMLATVANCYEVTISEALAIVLRNRAT